MKKTSLIAVICGFVIISVFLGVMASKVYEVNTSAASLHETDKIITYFTDTIKQNEHVSEVRAASVNRQLPALVMQQNIGGEISEIWLFVYDGDLRMTEKTVDSPIVPEDSKEILPLESADFIMLESDLLEITFTTTDGDTETFNIHIADMEGGIQ